MTPVTLAYDAPIDHHRWSTRTRNVLRALHVEVFCDLCDLAKSDIRHTKNAGALVLKEIIGALATYGMCLNTNPMTQDVLDAIAEIGRADAEADWEAAHSREDDMIIIALRAVVAHPDRAKEIAQLAVDAHDYRSLKEYPRWYA